MNWSYIVLLISLIYGTALIAAYFSKKRIKNIDNYFFSLLLIISYFNLILSAVSYFLLYCDAGYMSIQFFERCSLICLLFWMFVYILYVISNCFDERFDFRYDYKYLLSFFLLLLF